MARLDEQRPARLRGPERGEQPAVCEALPGSARVADVGTVERCEQAHERRGIAESLRAQGRGEHRADRGVRVTADHEVDQVGDGDRDRAPSSGGVDERPMHATDRVQLAGDDRDVGPRRARRPATAGVVADRGENAGNGAQRRSPERVGTVGGDDGIEDQAVDVRGIALRVGDRHLGAVGRAPQGDAVDAERDPHGLDVIGRVARRVRRALCAEIGGARANGRRDRRAGGSDHARADESSGAARSPLVERDELVGRARAGHHRHDRGEDAQRRLARPARQEQQRSRRHGARDGALDVQVDRAGHRVRAIDRHRHGGALEARSAGRERRRGERRRGQRKRAHDERDQGDGSGGERHRRKLPSSEGVLSTPRTDGAT